jgi:hypothetical protein
VILLIDQLNSSQELFPCRCREDRLPRFSARSRVHPAHFSFPDPISASLTKKRVPRPVRLTIDVVCGGASAGASRDRSQVFFYLHDFLFPIASCLKVWAGYSCLARSITYSEKKKPQPRARFRYTRSGNESRPCTIFSP